MDEIREMHSLVYLLICSARSSVTEIYYVHVFPLDSRQCWALSFGQIASRPLRCMVGLYHWHESSGKTCTYLFNYISVTDDIETNQQNKSIGIGLLYVNPEFDALGGEVGNSNPVG